VVGWKQAPYGTSWLICPECLSEMGFHINTIEGNKLNSEEGKMK
jgi:hypothetical protein